MATSLVDATLHTPKVLVQTQLAATETTQYTVAAENWVTLKGAVLCNTSTATVGVSISLVKAGNTAGASSRVLALTLSSPTTLGLAAGDSYVVAELNGVVLGPGDFISTLASTASAVTMVVSGVVSSGVVVVGPPAPRPFFVVQEYFHDGGSIATNQSLDLGFNSASFKAVLTSGESTFLTTHHPSFSYFCIPQNLVRASVPVNYPQTLDANYLTTMANLVSLYGIDRMYLFGCPEWDNDPGNNGWAQNRFTEAGVTGTRQDLPSGLTRQQAYDQWFHFYLADNHSGNTNHHQLGQILSVPLITRGYKVQSNNINAGTCHFAYEMGIDLVTLQRNNDDVAGIIGSLPFIRGAGTQYGKEWGWDTSHSRSYGPLAGVTTYSGSTLTAGWSEATYKRTRYLEYMSGADVIMEEASTLTGTATTINGRGYNPLAVGLRDFCDFALVRHNQRGVPHVPVAVMKDHISNWEPKFGQFNQGRGVWIQQMSPNSGEHMLYNLWDLLYPNYNTASSSTTAAEPWGSGRWGEQFDVITERASTSVLGVYPVVMLSTDTAMDATLQAKLNTFATAGGIVVINAKQLTGTAHETLTGVHLVGTASTSGTVTWDADSTTTTEPTFNYSTITLGTATVLAHSGASTPQVTRNIVGAGEVWVVMPDWMSNQANTATLGLAAKIITVLIARFAVAAVSGGNHNNIDYTITKQAGANATTTVVTIINTDAGNTTWTGSVDIPTGSPVQEWIADVTPSSAVSGGQVHITASVPGGDVKVYAVG